MYFFGVYYVKQNRMNQKIRDRCKRVFNAGVDIVATHGVYIWGKVSVPFLRNSVKLLRVNGKKGATNGKMQNQQ